MSTDTLHAIVSGLLIGCIILGVQHTSLVEGKTKLQRFGIFFVIGFFAMLILNLIWPAHP